MARADHHRALAGLAAMLLITATALLAAGTAQAAAAAGAGAGAGGGETTSDDDGVPTLPSGVRCIAWHKMMPGDTCDSVARDARLTVDQLRVLNKNVGCAALIRWRTVCVRGYAIGG